MLRNLIKRIFFPGFDLNTRSRYRWLPRYFSFPGDVLDVGCGNGALCYAAFKLGNNVLGVSFSVTDIKRNQNYFSSFVHSDRLQFKTLNAYDLLTLNKQYDQIICSEALEHIKNDDIVVKHFNRLLKINVVLHLCCPNAKHREHCLGRTDGPEDGGHVRDGYTLETYSVLLERSGFKIVESLGIGAPALLKCDKLVNFFRNKWGALAASPFFILVWPFLSFLDQPVTQEPYSLYVKAVKIENVV